MKYIWISLFLFSFSVAAEELCGQQDSRFQLQDDGVVVDTKSNLTWMRCSLGMQWQAGECVGRAGRYEWRYISENVEPMNNDAGFAGFNDWRLPSLQELQTLVESSCRNPSINSNYFSRTPASGYWSSTIDPFYDEGMMLVYFLHGKTYMTNKRKDWFIRLVRK
jgi:hypothetical protein